MQKKPIGAKSAGKEPAKKKTITKKKKEVTTPKVSYHYKPDNLTLQEWQIALRRQMAVREQFAITEKNRKKYPGYYQVTNPASFNEYSVVYRGAESLWNYCSCMDFKTSQLGTCKHLEAVKLWLKENRKKACTSKPPYTSVYLSYRGERQVCLRIGTDNEEEFRELSIPYFTPKGAMRPEAVDTIHLFFREATQLNNTFRWYPDALAFILEQRDRRIREQSLPEYASDVELDALLKTQLYPYQKEGIRFAFCAGKSIIADEMGLGKTIQALGTAELMRKCRLITSALIICPTSLKYQWKKEIERFTDARAVVVEGNHLIRKKMYEAEEFYKIVSYNSACNDIKIMKSLHTDFLIMDEVQRLKNWNTQIARSARHIESEYAVILSGTPLENKLEDLYSIVQLVDQYRLGPYYQFIDDTILKSDTGKVMGYTSLNAVGDRLKEILIRRRKKDVALQLPARMDKVLFVPMTEEQRGMHEECQSEVAKLVAKWTHNRFLSEKDRKRLLLQLSMMRMVCDSTYILDQKTRCDTKVEETMNILRNVFESGDEKVVIFSQWERMTRLIVGELDKLNVGYEYLHGGIPSNARKDLVDNFTGQSGKRVFISTDAGSTGLNLQVASILINLDLPWNPAVLEQRIARIYRIGQKRNIQVINMVASQTIEERMLSTLNFKSSLFEGVLDNGEDSIFLEDSKLEKIMESIKVMTDTDEMNVETRAGSDMDRNDIEKQREQSKKEEEKKIDAPDEIIPNAEEELMDDSPAAAAIHKQPEALVQQGISFFTGLARTLSSPEATQKLVDSIVEKDEATGQTSLRIPVADKETVVNALNLIGKLLMGK